MPASQPDLFDLASPEPPRGAPEGLAYRPQLLSCEHERSLLTAFADLDFRPFEFHGWLGKRRIASFGWRYDYAAGRARPAAPIPDFLRPVSHAVAAFAALSPDAFQQAMVTEYAPGAAIGWHRDKAEFGVVAGVSLLTPCPFRLRRRKPGGWERVTFTAEPRSAYVLRGPARRVWEHSIPPLSAMRYSITFRTLAEDHPAE